MRSSAFRQTANVGPALVLTAQSTDEWLRRHAVPKYRRQRLANAISTTRRVLLTFSGMVFACLAIFLLRSR